MAKSFFCQTIVFSGFCVKKVKQGIIWKIDARILFLAQFNKKYSKYLPFNDYPDQIINFKGTQKIIDYKFFKNQIFVRHDAALYSNLFFFVWIIFNNFSYKY